MLNSTTILFTLTPHAAHSKQGIEMHYDGCDITCKCTAVMLEIELWYKTGSTNLFLIRREGQAMLTRIDEYEGGGTYFRALRKTVKLQQGQVLVHPGKILY